MVIRKKSIPRSIGFTLLILAIVLFTIFPFVQMLSLSLKYQFDWGNPSLIPRKINLEAYKELLNIGQQAKDVPETVKRLLDNPELTSDQKKQILAKYKDTGDVFPFLKYFRNSILLSVSAAFFSLIIAVLGAYSFSRVRYRGRAYIQRGYPDIDTHVPDGGQERPGFHPDRHLHFYINNLHGPDPAGFPLYAG